MGARIAKSEAGGGAEAPRVEGDGGSAAAARLPDWAQEVIDRIVALGEDRVLVSVCDDRGCVLDASPIIPDFGDILPFLSYFGQADFAAAQIAAARRYLREGLYAPKGRLQAFLNHDWLLGLLDLHRLSGSEAMLRAAEESTATLLRRLEFRGIIRNEVPRLLSPRSWLLRADPFNGGYIELFVELEGYTGESWYAETAERLAKSWIDTPFFQAHGLFRRVDDTPLGRLDSRLRGGAPVLLFKDNTNLVYGLLSLYRRRPETWLRAAIERWIAAFAERMWNSGNVVLQLDAALRPVGPCLKAAFPSLDLLCDCAAAGIAENHALHLGQAIGSFWLGHQWENGLFPEVPNGERDHLDAVTDMVVALHKLAELTGENRFRDAARGASAGLVSSHRTPHGFILAVDHLGRPRDRRVVVKYQALLLKLVLLSRVGDGFFSDTVEASLLRDR